MRLRCRNCAHRIGLGFATHRLWNGFWYKMVNFCGPPCRENWVIKFREEKARIRAASLLIQEAKVLPEASVPNAHPS